MTSGENEPGDEAPLVKGTRLRGEVNHAFGAKVFKQALHGRQIAKVHLVPAISRAFFQLCMAVAFQLDAVIRVEIIKTGDCMASIQ